MGFDLSAFDSRRFADQGVDMQLVIPGRGKVFDEEGKPVSLRLGGADSTRLRSAVSERLRRRIEDIQASPKSPIVNPDQSREDVIDDLVTLTLGWSDNVVLDGKALPFTAENARLLYTTFPEITEQAQAFVSNRINFMRASPRA